jgi:AhpD family alkylhydroperoxidase
MMLSPAPELLAPLWALLRESLVAGAVPRWHKEIVAVSVSQTNRCAYDVAGHLVFLRLAGGEYVADALERGAEPTDPQAAAIARWARSAGAAPLSTADAPEYVGTALALHFINRLVLVLLNADLLPGSMRDGEPPAFAGAPIARAIQRQRPAGVSLGLLRSLPTDGLPAWASASPVGVAYAALRDAARLGQGLLTASARDVVSDTVSRWWGRELTGDRGWLAEPLGQLTPAEQRGATLAILAALAPAEITGDDVAAWRGTEYTDHCLLHLLGYGAITAVELVEADLAAGVTPSGCRPSR